MTKMSSVQNLGGGGGWGSEIGDSSVNSPALICQRIPVLPGLKSAKQILAKIGQAKIGQNLGCCWHKSAKLAKIGQKAANIG